MPSNFEYIAKFGSNGTGNQQLDTPSGMATNGKYLYIADTANNRILKWTLCGGNYVAQQSTNLSAPKDIEIFRGRLFVADSGNNTIRVFDTNLKEKSNFGSLSTPVSIATDGEFLYVCEQGNHRISVYDRDLNLEFTFGSNGTGNNQLDTPNQIAFSRREKCLYIVDTGNTRVMKWLKRKVDFLYVDKIVASDSVDSSLAGLNGIVINEHYVYLLEVSRVQVFDGASLTTRSSSGTSGTGNTNISDGGYIVSHRDTLIFSDQGNDRIMYWYNYNPARSFASGDTMKIQGGFFVNPVIPIGGKQEQTDVTIGGTNRTDKFIHIEEDKFNSNYASVEET